jgi:hypothetical protein
MGTRLYLFCGYSTMHDFSSSCFSQSAAHGGQQCNKFMAYALSHKGKATSSLNEYTSMAREVHGQEYDPTQEDLDAEIVMKVGGGKKHGRYWICDGAIDSSSTPTLSQIKARQTSSSAGIRPRPDSSTSQVQALQVVACSYVFYLLYYIT